MTPVPPGSRRVALRMTTADRARLDELAADLGLRPLQLLAYVLTGELELDSAQRAELKALAEAYGGTAGHK